MVLAAICLTQGASAGNVIELWGPGADPNNPNHYVLGTNYWIDQIQRIVEIWHGSNPDIPWYFQAYDSETGDPGTLDSISIAPTGPVGVIHLSVIGDPNHPQGGAAFLKKLDLVTGADADTYVDEVSITTDFGEVGPLKATHAGTLTIGNDVLNNIEITQDMGQVTIGGALLADITTASLGDLSAGGADDPNHAPTITIADPAGATRYDGTLHICGFYTYVKQIVIGGGEFGGSVSSSADLNVEGALDELRVWFDENYASLSGVVTIGRSLGTAWLGNGVGAGGLLKVYGDTTSVLVAGDIAGKVEVDGKLEDVAALGIVGGGSVVVGSDLTGQGLIVTCIEREATFDIGGDLSGQLLISTESAGCEDEQDPNRYYAVDGQVTVRRDLSGYLGMGAALGGRVDVLGEVSGSGLVEIAGGDLAGSLHVGQSLVGSVYVGHLSGTVAIDGDLSGGIFIPDGNLSGAVQIGGNMSGYVGVGYDPNNLTARDLSGTLTVGGDLNGNGIGVWGHLGDPNDPNMPGQIIVNGAFGNVQGDTRVTIHEEMVGSRSFVCFDYDGYDPNHPDRWGQYGLVSIDGTSYTENTPAAMIFECTPCRGDCDNSGFLDFDDIDPFVLALSDPNGYAEAFPGLAGSIAFHADMNCDGLVNLDDINPFIARLSCDPNEACSPYCEPCSGGDLMAAPQLAAGMRAHVPAERLPALRAFAAQVIAHHHNRNQPQQRAYWQQVLAGLQ
jgi:hypothetical protein